jgi:hypothetical protein
LLADRGLPIDLAVARIAYGRALAETGRLAAARRELELARETLREVGATGLVADVEQELELIAGGAGA